MPKRKPHETQLAIIGLFAVEDELSPKKVARMLDKPLPSIAYHFGRLKAFGTIELSRTEPVRGSYEHFYRLRKPDDGP
jgi:hypothetical protein